MKSKKSMDSNINEGVTTGLTELDNLIGPLRPGYLVGLVSRPSVGKTSLALGIATHIAKQTDRVVAFFTLEMTREVVGRMLLAQSAKIALSSIDENQTKALDWKRLSDGADQLSKAKLFIDDATEVSTSYIANQCTKLKSKEGRIDLIIIDYLQLMNEFSVLSQKPADEIIETTRILKRLAKSFECPILLLSQLNQNVEMREDKRPTLDDICESSSIEEEADIVLFLYRDELYNNNASNKGIAEIIVAKNHFGDCGNVKVGYLAPEVRFVDLP